jgi:hypothetical protein
MLGGLVLGAGDDLVVDARDASSTTSPLGVMGAGVGSGGRVRLEAGSKLAPGAG